MNHVASALFSTPLGAFFLGAGATLGVVSSGLSLIFFFRLRHKSLLLFSITILLSYMILGLLNRDPTQVFDVGADPIYLRLVEVVTGFAGYFFYRLVLSAFPPHPSRSHLPVSVLSATFLLAVVARGMAIVMMTDPVIRFASLTTGCFEITTIAYVLTHPISTRSMLLNKAGCCLFSLGVMIYPLTRAGVISPLPSSKYGPFITLGTLSIISIGWLFALVEYLRERIERAEMAPLKNMARAFIQLRDLMNTPLQVIEFSMSLLPEEIRKNRLTLDRIEHALSQLRTINVALTRYEKDVDWEQQDDFLDIASISKEGPKETADEIQPRSADAMVSKRPLSSH
jgi:hypothetical protein